MIASARLCVYCAFFFTVGCKTESFDRTLEPECGSTYSEFYFEAKNEDNGQKYLIAPSREGKIKLKNLPQASYIVRAKALDLQDTFLAFHSIGRFNLPDEVGKAFTIPNQPNFESIRFEYNGERPLVHISDITSSCLSDENTHNLSVYTSWKSPIEFQLDTTEFVVSDTTFVQGMNLTIESLDSLFYLMLRIMDENESFVLTSSLVEVVEPEIIISEIKTQGETNFKVFKARERWMSVDAEIGTWIFLELFGQELKSFSGSKLKLSCYSDNLEKTYFEKRPCWGDDYSPIPIYKVTDGPLLLKLEIDPLGSDGRFQSYVRLYNELGDQSFDTTLLSADWQGSPFRVLSEEVSAGTFELKTWRNATSDYMFRYTLINETNNEILIHDAEAGNDENNPRLHDIILTSPATLVLVCSKSYSGNGNDAFHIELNPF